MRIDPLLRRRSSRNEDAELLVREATAIIAGRYAEWATAAGRPVPVWAWMNLLAHGTEEALRTEAERLCGARGWRHARSAVAAEILDLADAGHIRLSEVQRDVLLPLELDVMACANAATWTPRELFAGLLAAVRSQARRGREVQRG
jgi:hypothetical protein